MLLTWRRGELLFYLLLPKSMLSMLLLVECGNPLVVATNYKFTLRTNMLMVEKMAVEAGQYVHIRKWERGMLENIKESSEINVRQPDLIVFLCVQNMMGGTHQAIYEAARLPIPTVGICDSNCGMF